MKKLFLIFTILAFLIVGCGQNKNDQTTEKTNKNNSNKTAQVSTNKDNSNNVLPGVSMQDQKILADAKMYDGSFDSDAILLTKSAGEGSTFKMEGTNTKGLKMPDGNLWPVKKVGDKTMLVMPDGKLIQEKIVDGKIMLLNNDKTYEVKMIGHNLVAFKTDNSKVNVAEK